MNGLRTVIELADTTSTITRGDADTVYRMQPRIWLKTIVDAAQKKLYAAQFAYRSDLQSGQNSVVIPKRRVYFGSGSASTWTGSATEGSAVPYTSLNNISGVAITPTDENFGVCITNAAIRKTAVDLVKLARDELTYVCGDAVDRAVVAAMNSDSDCATAGNIGSQAIYGGDATSGATLANGDILTTDIVAKGSRQLKSSLCRYYTYGTGDALCSERKNPWSNESGEPFVLLIAPEQEEVLLTDSQFVNASEYGGNEVIKNGEIGSYLGIKIIVSDNTASYNASVTHADATTTTVAQHRCMLFKAHKAAALVYGQKPRLVVFDFPSELEKRLVIEQAYAAGKIHPDAIVHINVSDQ
jgi:N4-gp56 family major capsid protein